MDDVYVSRCYGGTHTLGINLRDWGMACIHLVNAGSAELLSEGRVGDSFSVMQIDGSPNGNWHFKNRIDAQS